MSSCIYFERVCLCFCKFIDWDLRLLMEYCLDEHEWDGLNFNPSVFCILFHLANFRNLTFNETKCWCALSICSIFLRKLFGEYRICKCLLNVYYFEIFNVKWFNLENDDWCILCMHIWLSVEILEKKTYKTYYIYLFHFWIQQRKQKHDWQQQSWIWFNAFGDTTLYYIHTNSVKWMLQIKKGWE